MELIDRLRTALEGRYEVEDEVGSGATAIVFRALDLRHSRPVALKVLRPEVANSVGSERFLREIEISSKLTHPHILPLYDSGQADGLFFFIMPFVAGDSLRERMEKEGPLPLEEALDITEQIAGALQYAHGHGILHRDIKPENIMLSEGQAFLADLGIARAMGEAGTDHLTRTGLAVGTPLYMSPEQAAGQSRLDGRADVYSLACVLFEMLSGQPPFTGPNSQAILAKHAMEAVPSLRIMRSAMSASLEVAIKRALEKTPADRYQTPGAFAENLRTAFTESSTVVEDVNWTRRWRWLPAAWTVTGVAAGILLFWLFTSGPLSPTPQVDSQLLAVLPFSLDPSLDAPYLSITSVAEAMASRFDGTGGPRAAPSESVVDSWEEEGGHEAEVFSEAAALRVAEEVGAGFVLTGRVHPQGGAPILDARILAVPGGQEVARVDALRWPSDDLDPALDQVTIQLLVQLSGEVDLMEDLTSRDLSVVRDYLEALRKYGAGLYEQAFQHLSEALEADSLFALAGMAALRLEETTRNSGPVDWYVAYDHRDQLARRDNDHLTYLLGEQESGVMSFSTRMHAWDLISMANEDDALTAYFHGKTLLERGGATPHDGILPKSRETLRRALDLRPGFVPALEGLLEVESILGDFAEVLSVAEEILEFEPAPDHAGRVRWWVASLEGDTATLGEIRDGFDGLSRDDLEWIMWMSQATGNGLEDAWNAVEVYQSQAELRTDVFEVSLLSRALALNLGRPEVAAGFLTDEPFNLPRNNLLYILEALYWDGSQERAESEVVESRAMLLRSGRQPFAYSMDRCSLGLWDLAAGDTTGVQMAIDSLRSWEPETVIRMLAPVCAEMLEVERALTTGAPDLRSHTAALDTLMNPGPWARVHVVNAANLTLARGWEALGEPESALEAVRRRSRDPWNGPPGLSALLREEGRLAAMTGDVDGAIEAYRHYLALRQDPEPSLRATVDSVRAELVRLEAGGS